MVWRVDGEAVAGVLVGKVIGEAATGVDHVPAPKIEYSGASALGGST